MNIYIHSYIYFIYNARPAVNIFTIVYYLGTKYSRQQNLVTGSTADVCQPVAEPVSKCIKKINHKNYSINIRPQVNIQVLNLCGHVVPNS